MNNYGNIDTNRTDLLKIRELYVLKDMGSRNVFFTVPRLSHIYKCPYCQCNKLKNLGARHKQYKHICVIDKDPDADAEVVTLDYKYNKYKCLNEKCGKVFTPKNDFASPYSRITNKLADAIVKMIWEYIEVEEIAFRLNNIFDTQTIKTIYLRRINEYNPTPEEKEFFKRYVK